MKAFIIIALLSALAACYGAAVHPSEEISGVITVVENADEVELQKFLSTYPGRQISEPVLLFEREFYVPGVPGEVITHKIEYIGGPDTVVTGSQRIHIPPLPTHVHTEGFLTNHVVITMTSQVGGSLFGIVRLFGYEHGY